MKFAKQQHKPCLMPCYISISFFVLFFLLDKPVHDFGFLESLFDVIISTISRLLLTAIAAASFSKFFKSDPENLLLFLLFVLGLYRQIFCFLHIVLIFTSSSNLEDLWQYFVKSSRSNYNASSKESNLLVAAKPIFLMYC